MRTTVVAQFTIEGFHNWPEAPDNLAFLRDRHRHVFHVGVQVRVNHSDRDVEVISLGRAVKAGLIDHFGDPAELHEWSCEHLANWIWSVLFNRMALTPVRVTVLEDGENGAEAVE
jgi:hypothetical protein